MSYRFRPWAPSSEDPRIAGVRLLVLGESHYEEENGDGSTYRDADATVEETRNTVRKYGVKPEKRQVFFANLYTMLSGEPWALEASRLEPFWNSIFFYNYVQTLVPGGPRHSPSPSMWREAEKPFRTVIEEIAPEAILVVGKRLWSNMAQEDERLDEQPDGLGLICGYHLPSGDTIPAACTRHPSSFGFRPMEWHPRIRHYLNWVRTRARD